MKRKRKRLYLVVDNVEGYAYTVQGTSVANAMTLARRAHAREMPAYKPSGSRHVRKACLTNRGANPEGGYNGYSIGLIGAVLAG